MKKNSVVKNGLFGGLNWSGFLAVAVAVLMLGSVFAVIATGSGEKGGKAAENQTLYTYIYDNDTYGWRNYYINTSDIRGFISYSTDHTGDHVFYGTGSGSLDYYDENPDYHDTYYGDNAGNLYATGEAFEWAFNGEWTLIAVNPVNATAGYTYTDDTGTGAIVKLPEFGITRIPAPTASVSGSDVDVSWPDWVINTTAGGPNQFKGYTIWRSTTNATWNDNPDNGTVSGSISDWIPWNGTAWDTTYTIPDYSTGDHVPVAGALVTSPFTDSSPPAGTYYYSIKLVFNGSSNVETMWGGFGSNFVEIAYKADLMIKKDAEAETLYAINDTYYNTEADAADTDQNETATLDPNDYQLYDVKVENNGTVDDTINVTWVETKDGLNWDVVVKNETGTTITSPYITPTLSAGGCEILTINISTTGGSPGDTCKVVMQADPEGDGVTGVNDTVIAWAKIAAGAVGLTSTVNSPNGGEDWTGGSSKWINYTISGGTPDYTVKLYYSTTGASGAMTFIDYDNQTAAGTFNYTWTVPFVDSANCFVNVSVNDSFTSDYDLSDAAFTIDSTAPTVSSTDPADAATDVVVSTDVVVTFSEPMNTSAAETGFGLYKEGSTSKVAGAITWNATNEKLTFDPTSDLDSSAKYYINITTDAKDDSAPGNALSSAFSASFTTTSGISVTVNSPNGGQDWTGGSSKWINYTISGGSGPYTVKLYYSTNGASGAMTFIAYNNQTATGTFNYTWTVPSEDSTNCYVNVSVNDSSTSGYDLSDAAFTIDSTAPTVSSTDPADTATDVVVSTDVVVTFSEPMNTSAAETGFGLYKEGSTSKVAGAITWNATNEKLTFDPTSDLDSSAKYYINITTDAKDDSAPGNALASAFSASFTTASLSVTVNSPNGGQDWTGDSSKWINYTISGGSGPYTVKLYYSTNGASGTMTFIAYDNRSAAGTFNYTWAVPSEDSKNCYVNVSVNDSSLSSYDLSDAAFTIDSTAPTVSSTDPADAATDVSTATDIVVTFSEPMNTAAVEDAFNLSKEGSGTKVAGSFAWNTTNEKLTFDPTPALDTNAKYYINITTGAKDDSDPGNAIASAFSASFTTGAISGDLSLTASGADVSPSNAVLVGNTYNVSVTVVLTTNGVENIEVWVNVTGGTVPFNETITISSTKSKGSTETRYTTNEFTVKKGETYNIKVGIKTDDNSDNNGPVSRDVTAVEAPPAPTTSFEPTVIGIGIAVLVVAVLGTAVIWRKRKEKKKTKE